MNFSLRCLSLEIEKKIQNGYPSLISLGFLWIISFIFIASSPLGLAVPSMISRISLLFGLRRLLEEFLEIQSNIGALEDLLQLDQSLRLILKVPDRKSVV